MGSSSTRVRTEGSARAITWSRSRRIVALIAAAVAVSLPLAGASAAESRVDATSASIAKVDPGSIGLQPNRGSTWT